jgi:hypothetical protein
MPRINRQIPIKLLEQAAKGLPVQATIDPEVAARVDAAGTPDGIVTRDEIQSSQQRLQAASAQLGAVPNPTKEQIQTTALLVAEQQRLSPMGFDLIERTDRADLWATVSHNIDELLKLRGTGERIGNGDGEISTDELRTCIDELKGRIAKPTPEDDVNQLSLFVEIAGQLLEQLERE